MITIDEDDYEELVERSEWLECLENAGVDNWEGYNYARDLWQEKHPDND